MVTETKHRCKWCGAVEHCADYNDALNKFCTLEKGHPGLHVAYDTELIVVATWPHIEVGYTDQF